MNAPNSEGSRPCPGLDGDGVQAGGVSSTDLGVPAADSGDRELYELAERENPLLIVISGPSGVGKDATVKRMKELGLPFFFVVTATTRPRRPGEIDGVDYHFLSQEEFQALLEQGELLEHALVYGQYKGIPKQQVRDALNSGLDVVLRVDVQGAATIRQLVPSAVLIFLAAASEEELIGRLVQRQTDPVESLRTRIATARLEMKRIHEFDYVIVNSHCHLDDTVEQIKAVIVAEKRKVLQREVKL